MASTPYLRSLFIGIFILIFSFESYSQSGKVYRDFNSNGIIDADDIGLSGIKVQAFRSDGTLSGSAVSSATGEYALAPAAALGEQVRVEFVLPPAFADYYPSSYTAQVGGSGTSVQFVTGPAENVNYGINLTGDFCDATPPLSIVCFVVGSGITIGDNLIATVPASATGTPESPGAEAVGHPSTPPSLVGSIWGTAWQPETGRLFSAAFVRRHTALGTGGTGAIYVTNDPRNPDNATSDLFINLNGLTVNTSTGGNVLIDTGTDPHMTEAYYQTIKQTNDPENRFIADFAHPGGNPADAIGKIGLGDMDLSNDQRYLYVINPGQNHLYRITIDADGNPATNPTAADVIAYLLPDPACTGGTARPFGLGVRSNNVFIGTICDGAQSNNYSDLSATIYKLDTDTDQLSTAVTFSLDYKRGTVSGGEYPIPKGNWQPWNADLDWSNGNAGTGEVFSLTNQRQVSSPQPMLSDIAFDDDGSLIAAFTDRFGHMSIFGGPDPIGSRSPDGNLRVYDGRAGGDILRICNVGTLVQPVYALEQNGQCGSLGGVQFTQAQYGTDANGDPIEGEFEYYVGDNFNYTSHTETTMGAVAVIPGSGELIVTAFDPIMEDQQGRVYTNGFKVLSNQTGQHIRAFSLINDIPQDNGNNYFGKATGLGGIEVLCLPKALEIGNRVWLDANNNGIQDAGEAPIAGVALELLNAGGQVVGQTVTDQSGSFIFNQSNVMDASTSSANQPAKPGVRVFSDYTIRVSSTQFNKFGTGVLANLVPTSTSVNSGDGSGERDNNAGLMGTSVGFPYKTGQSGQSDHTLDIGFRPGQAQLELTKTVSATQVPVGSLLSYTVLVRNTGTASASALSVQDQPDPELTILSSTPSSGTVETTANGLTWTLPELAPDQTSTLIIRATANQAGTLRNQATTGDLTATVSTIVSCPSSICAPITLERLR